jgi:hypothetical protein
VVDAESNKNCYWQNDCQFQGKHQAGSFTPPWLEFLRHLYPLPWNVQNILYAEKLGVKYG